MEIYFVVKQIKIQPGGSSRGSSQPGWGSVPNPDDWKVMDELNQLEEDRKFGRVESRPYVVENSPDELDSIGSEAEDAATDDTQEAATEQAACLEVPKGASGTFTQNAPSFSQDYNHIVEGNKSEQQSSKSRSEEGSDEIHLGKQELESLQESLRSVGVSECENMDNTEEASCSILDTQSRNPVASQVDDIGMEHGGIVACMTSDFSMQNVLIQMGLQVLTPDGRRIQKVKKWGMRCTACFHVSKQVSPHTVAILPRPSRLGLCTLSGC